LLVSFLVAVLFLTSFSGTRYSPSGAYQEFRENVDNTASRIAKLPIERLLFGIGTRNVNNLKQATPPNPLVDDLPENMYLVPFLENGLFGCFLMLWIILATLKTLFTAYEEVTDPQLQRILWAIFSSIVGFLVAINNDDAFFNLPIQLLFWGLIGSGLAIAVRFSHRNLGFIRLWRFGD